ncbi:MAG: hypothetical protein HY787_15355 [Deltaproteobacteria bacterium]|nr:hypothetical protein [Deltaproteobacteria bacterium]
MTAEIAIMNKTAVALAADSAVTIGQDKIFNSVNKLFTLSKYHPIGVMIYGSATFMGVPWESIIKRYRSDLKQKKYSTLKEYADDFMPLPAFSWVPPRGCGLDFLSLFNLE